MKNRKFFETQIDALSGIVLFVATEPDAKPVILFTDSQELPSPVRTFALTEKQARELGYHLIAAADRFKEVK